MRVVSLLPSATETLCGIESGREMLVGRSHECDFPHGLEALPVLTSQRTNAASSADIDRQVREALASDAAASLYILDAALLRELKPDVILTQDLCEVCSIDLNTVRAATADLRPMPRIVSLNPHTLEDVFDDVLRVGESINRASAARAAVVALRERYWSARDFVNPYVEGPEVAFLEWLDPLFCGGHWTPQLIETGGGRHSLNPAGAKSRRITPEELVAISPQRLVICPCGYALAQTCRELPGLTVSPWWASLPAVQHGSVAVVDGSAMFNRPGPRLVDAYCWLVGWLNDRPELVPAGFPWIVAGAARCINAP